jgi:hypothetical protein
MMVLRDRNITRSIKSVTVERLAILAKILVRISGLLIEVSKVFLSPFMKVMGYYNK